MNSNYNSPRWSNEIADCAMPMTFDTYSNCSFGCLYCFSQFQRYTGGSRDEYVHKDCRSVNIEKIKRMFLHPETSQFGDYIKQRKVLQWGGLSDQFDMFEKKNGVTLELLKFFKDIDYPICFSTKSHWFVEDERYMDLIKGQKNWNFKFSIITLDEEKAKKVERGVGSPLQRLGAMEKIANANCGGATLRLRPFIIGISTPTYIDLIREAGKRGAGALSTEFMCVDNRSQMFRENVLKLNDICGFDLMSFYKKYSNQRVYMRLNRKVKEPFVNKMQEACKEVGMRFYVSDSDFKERCSNGCCCGLTEDWNYSRGQFTQALLIAKEKGTVRYSDVVEDAKKILSNVLYSKANGFNQNTSEKIAKFTGMSLEDYMRYLWNNPQRGQSPYTLFNGKLTPITTDDNGDLIYKYKADEK